MTKSKRQKLVRARTPFELSILIVAGLSVLAIVIALAVSGLSLPEGPPDLQVKVLPQQERSGGIPYVVEVHNVGGETAESVTVEVTVGSEKREADLLAVARGDTERATVVFPPGTTGSAKAEILAYTETGR